ncbi:hypothetical protein Tco_0808315 [Tanacetum coccineum]
MASLDRRLNPFYAIKECSSCGTLHTKDCGCSKGSLEDKILVPLPDLSQRPLKIEKICLDCGDPVHGLYCRQCALIRKTLEEVFQDFQDTSKSSNDDTNFVNQEPFITTSSVNDVLVSLAGKVLIMVIIVHRKFRLSLNRNHATIKPLMSSHRLCQVFNRHLVPEVDVICSMGGRVYVDGGGGTLRGINTEYYQQRVRVVFGGGIAASWPGHFNVSRVRGGGGGGVETLGEYQPTLDKCLPA